MATNVKKLQDDLAGKKKKKWVNEEMDENTIQDVKECHGEQVIW